MEFVAVDPASTYAKDVRVLRKGHELGLALKASERMQGEGVEIKDLERAGIWTRGFWRGRVVHGCVYDRGRAEPDGGTDGVVAGAIAERRGG